MKKIYEARDDVHANLLKEILESNGIKAVVQGERLFSGLGELPVIYPSLWVADEDEDAGRKMAEVFDKGAARGEREGAAEVGESQVAGWTCPLCHELNEAVFSECWKCAGEGENQPVIADERQVPLDKTRARLVLILVLVAGLFIISFFVVSGSQSGGFRRESRPPLKVR